MTMPTAPSLAGALICVMSLVYAASGKLTRIAGEDVFHQLLSRDVLLDLFDIAERELKVFIYPIPDYVDRYRDEDPSNWQRCVGRSEIHFCIEELFVRYLRDVRDNFDMYPHIKTNFVHQSGENANSFVIDHTW